MHAAAQLVDVVTNVRSTDAGVTLGVHVVAQSDDHFLDLFKMDQNVRFKQSWQTKQCKEVF